MVAYQGVFIHGGRNNDGSVDDSPTFFSVLPVLESLPNDGARKNVLLAIGEPNNKLRWLAYALLAGWAQLESEAAGRDACAKFWNEHQDLLKIVRDKETAVATANKFVSGTNPTLAHYANEVIRLADH